MAERLLIGPSDLRRRKPVASTPKIEMQAKVTKPFKGAPDGTAQSVQFNPGDVIEGDLARVAVENGWARTKPKKKDTARPTSASLAGPASKKKTAKKSKKKTSRR